MTAIAVLAVAVFGSGPSGWQAAVTLVGFVVIGLPHGALDHRVGVRAMGLRPAVFYVAYLGFALAVGALWFWWPGPAAVSFLVASAWHFGEADVRHLRARRGMGHAVILSRGALIVGLLALSWPDQVVTLLGPWSPWPVGWSRTVALPAGLWSLHAGVILLGTRSALREVVPVLISGLVLAAWMWMAEPLLAFAGYFLCWHSLDHLDVLRRALRLNTTRLVASVIPYTVAAALGSALVVVLGLNLPVSDGALAGVALGSLAAVASPHLVVVELWRRKGIALY